MRLYNSLTRKKQSFNHPQNEPIKLYVCGITPYDTTHLGHAFTYTFFDVLTRYLKYKGYKINYVQNVTDIDDDILREANKVGKDWQALGSFWTDRFVQDIKNLNILPPTHFVKATNSIPKMVEIIKKLIKIGLAYEKRGNIYFSIQKDKEYGKLSRLNRKRMLLLAKERGGNPDDLNRIDPLDFLLWQAKKEAEPSWNSPWGAGRPGWHIECSAMIHQYLGETIDIHGGGKDLIFPHHESEIAQSEFYTDIKPFSRFFLHTAMILSNNEKMSKSLGNLVMIADLLKRYSPNTIRWYLLSHHYRRPFKYLEEDVTEAQKNVHMVEKALKIRAESQKQSTDVERFYKEFEESMDNDLDTLTTLTLLLKLARCNLLGGNKADKEALKILCQTLGFVVK